MPKKSAYPTHYTTSSGTSLPIPTLSDPEEDIIQYLATCVSSKISGVTYDQVAEIVKWLINRKPDLIDYLNRLAQEASSSTGINDKHRARAYRKAVAALQPINAPLILAKKGREIAGIGASISQKIEDFYFSDNVLESSNRSLKIELSKIWGAGPADVEKWIGMGVSSLTDLRQKIFSGDITPTQQQKIGVHHYEDFLLKIPRKEAGLFLDLVWDAVRKVDPVADVMLVGSYSRGAKTGSDIDILIISDYISGKERLKEVIEGIITSEKPAETRKKTESGEDSTLVDPSLKLGGRPPLEVVIGTLGDQQFMGAVANPLGVPTPFRRVDIFLSRPAEKTFALLQYTSSAEYNRMMRYKASEKGMLLNQRGLWLESRGGLRPNSGLTTEEEVFEELGLEWVPVNKRV